MSHFEPFTSSVCQANEKCFKVLLALANLFLLSSYTKKKSGLMVVWLVDGSFSE